LALPIIAILAEGNNFLDTFFKICLHNKPQLKKQTCQESKTKMKRMVLLILVLLPMMDFFLVIKVAA